MLLHVEYVYQNGRNNEEEKNVKCGANNGKTIFYLLMHRKQYFLELKSTFL